MTPVVGSGEGKHQKWQEREVVSALYADRQEILAIDEREVVGDFGHGGH